VTPFPLLSAADPREQALAREAVLLRQQHVPRPHGLLLLAAWLLTLFPYGAPATDTWKHFAAILAAGVATGYLVQLVRHYRWLQRRDAWDRRAVALEAEQRRAGESAGESS
jgi:hypothetical protein